MYKRQHDAQLAIEGAATSLGVDPAWLSRIRAGDRLDVTAVSYTHLRAHETVLDLVCRLLLEKKKDHKSAGSTSLANDDRRTSPRGHHATP